MTRNRSDTTTIDEAMTRFNCDRWFSVTESTGIRVWRNGKTRQYDYTQQRPGCGQVGVVCLGWWRGHYAVSGPVDDFDGRDFEKICQRNAHIGGGG